MCRCIVLYFYYFICIINIIFSPLMRGCTSWRIDPMTTLARWNLIFFLFKKKYYTSSNSTVGTVVSMNNFRPLFFTFAIHFFFATVLMKLMCVPDDRIVFPRDCFIHARPPNALIRSCYNFSFFKYAKF